MTTDCTTSDSGHVRPSHLVRFGRTDLFVSRYCQGTASVADNLEGRRVLEHCLDVGVNFFDSSNGYGDGGSEVALGRAIKKRRHQAVVLDKLAALQPSETEDGKMQWVRYTRDFILQETDGALRRLDTDYIDIYMLHHPAETMSAEEVVDTMDSLVKVGKLRYWGVSNHSASQVNALLEAGARDGKAPVAGLENYFNIANTQHLEELSPVLRSVGLGMVTFRPHQGGRPLTREQSDAPGTPGEALMKTLRQVSAELGRPVTQVCIAWVLSHPEITSVLTCAESTEHVEDNLAGTTLELPPEALSTLNAASDALRAAQESGIN